MVWKRGDRHISLSIVYMQRRKGVVHSRKAQAFFFFFFFFLRFRKAKVPSTVLYSTKKNSCFQLYSHILVPPLSIYIYYKSNIKLISAISCSDATLMLAELLTLQHDSALNTVTKYPLIKKDSTSPIPS
jgi:hypothetical protein